MTVRVLIPPDPIVTPDEVPGGADSAMVQAMIQAVTETIDGPNGWLGRALGEQTLELSGCSFSDMADCHGGILLPYPPLIEVETVTYLDSNGDEQDVDTDAWRVANGKLWLASGSTWPAIGTYPDAVRIRYRAGYDGVDQDSGGTGDVPVAATQAIILSVQHMMTVGSENLFLSSDEVAGIGKRQYIVSDAASALIKKTSDLLLAGLRIYPG